MIYASRRVYEGRVMNLRVDEVDKPRGGGRAQYEVVEHPGGAAIIALPSPQEIVLVHQRRHAVNSMLWELPAGMLEPGEDPILAATRELQEETGYTAKRMRFLRSVYSSPGFCQELVHLFLAEDLLAGEPMQDDMEDIEVRVWPLKEAWALVESNQLQDAKTQIGLSWMMLRNC